MSVPKEQKQKRDRLTFKKNDLTRDNRPIRLIVKTHKTELGYWEKYPSFLIFRNEHDEIIGVINNWGKADEISKKDYWVGWDYTFLDLEGEAVRLGYGSKEEMMDMVEGLINK